jgi:hypothetical protein
LCVLLEAWRATFADGIGSQTPPADDLQRVLSWLCERYGRAPAVHHVRHIPGDDGASRAPHFVFLNSTANPDGRWRMLLERLHPVLRDPAD